jgi:prepilin-type N-terminal cleavage/methylation domain-containing protein
MISRASKFSSRNGFTIVELLIVVVVIAILAAITIVAYNGIKQRADASALSSTLKQSVTWVGTQKASNGGIPPANLDGLTKSSEYTYGYKVIGSAYCVSVSNNSSKATYYAGSITAGAQYPGVCPYAHWSLAGLDNTGFSSVDASPVGNPSTTTNQKGQANSAYSLTTGKYLNLSDSQWADFFSSSNGFTVGAWVNLSQYGAETTSIVGQQYGTSMVFAVRNNGRLQLRMDDTGLGLQSTDAVPLNSWHYVAVTYTPSDNHNARYYLDGVPSGVVSTFDGSGITDQPNLYIGWQSRTSSGADSPFVGSVSEVSIYDRPLSDDEVMGVYVSSKP